MSRTCSGRSGSFGDSLAENEVDFFSGDNRGRGQLFGHVPEEAWGDWKWHFRHRITSPDGLAAFVPLSDDEKHQISRVSGQYPLSITPYYLSLINVAEPGGPLWKQAVPSIQEIASDSPGFEDPLAEEKHSVVPGLVHRYPDRVLMVVTNLCPIRCRHCTRKREWWGGVRVRTPDEIELMLGYIRANRAIRDVIISGGDPLSLSTHRLEEIISGLRRINHVEIVRIHSRFPVVLPQRIDNELCTMLSRYGPIWFNTQFNHPREITAEAALACDRLLRSGIPVNNQAVLLKGVNDSLATQLELCQGLLRIKVRPYYLFQCDEVLGTEHLRTPVESGINIIAGMCGRTSGLAVPVFAVDLPHGGGKVPLSPNYLLSEGNAIMVMKNYEGRIFYYRDPHPGWNQVRLFDLA